MALLARASMVRAVSIIRTKWIEAAAIAALTLVVTPLTCAREEVTDWWRRIRAERQNLAPSEALAIARQKFGAQTQIAWPFRNAASDAQFIAVVLDTTVGAFDTDSGFPMIDAGGKMVLRKVMLLEGAERDVMKYRDIDPELEATDSFSPAKTPTGEVTEPAYSSSIAGVTDIDRDGNKELYAVSRSGGMGAYSALITVYDVASGTKYSLDAGGGYGQVVLETEYSENVSKSPAIRDWLAATAATLNLAADSTTRSVAVRHWLADQGIGFRSGRLVIRKFPGQIPEATGFPVCTIDDGRYIWRSAFKDDVWAFDKNDNTHFLIFVREPGRQSMGRYVVAGARYLWFGDGEIGLALDKTTFELSSARAVSGRVNRGEELVGAKGCGDEDATTPDVAAIWSSILGDSIPSAQ